MEVLKRGDRKALIGSGVTIQRNSAEPEHKRLQTLHYINTHAHTHIHTQAQTRVQLLALKGTCPASSAATDFFTDPQRSVVLIGRDTLTALVN